jgi:hypothetical protein
MSAADVIGEEQAWVTAMPEALRGPAQSLNKAVVEPAMNKCVHALDCLVHCPPLTQLADGTKLNKRCACFGIGLRR